MPASSMTVKDGKLVISKGDIMVKGPSAGFIVRDVPDYGARVYAAGLNLDGGTLSLDSKTYVANDLILNGNGSRATLTKEYYGYGASVEQGMGDKAVTPSLSSAIIINGRNATVDMSGVNKLLLAGRAYIGQSLSTGLAMSGTPGGTPGTSKAVLMGESIAVKGNQIAYLVPAECIGTLDGKTMVGQNPLNGATAATVEDYKNQYGEDFKEVDFNKPIYKLDNKTLSDFGVTDMKHIRKLYTQYNSADSENKTLAYYYLVMDKDKAAEYFEQYYNFNASKETIDNYFKKYATGGIVLGDYTAENTQYTILGNSLVSDALSDSGVTLLRGLQATVPGDGDVDSGGAEEGEQPTPEEGYQEVSDNVSEMKNFVDESEVLELSETYAKTYKALTTNLTENFSTVGPDPNPNQNVFNSIIREGMLRDYLEDNGGTVVFKSEDGMIAVLTDCTGDGDGDNNTFTLSQVQSKLGTGGKLENIRLIVAIDKDSKEENEVDGVIGGNVIVDKHFTGLIVAQGEIAIAGNTLAVKRDKMGTYKALNAPLSDTDAQTAMDFFVNGSGILAEEVTENSKVDESGILDVDMSEIVRYMNWIKK